MNNFNFNNQGGFNANNGGSDFFDFNTRLNVSDCKSFTLLEPGIYPFMVKDVKTGFFQASRPDSKIQNGTPMVTVICEVQGDQGESADIKTDFFLTERMKWKSAEFFISLATPTDENGTFVVGWDPNALIGKTGHCKVSQTEGTRNKDAKFNRIDKFMEPQQSAPVTPASKTLHPQSAQPMQQPVQNQQTQTQYEQPNFNGNTGFQGWK